MGTSGGNFQSDVSDALADEHLQSALKNVRGNFMGRRAKARAGLPEFDALRDAARDIKNHTLSHLDLYLETYTKAAEAAGGVVHFAPSADDARAIVLEICQAANAKTVTKGKSMISEEIELNDFLDQNGIRPVETDLGEYIVQLRGEAPSHIIAPAVHVTKAQIESSFRQAHGDLPEDRDLSEPTALLGEARAILRDDYFRADVGITGANFLVAETGTSVIVTNEGNGDLTQLLPDTHIVVASIEKVVPTLEDLSTILRVLARSATGQEMSAYTTLSTGPRRDGDPDGPKNYHVIILDNGRSDMLAGDMREMLRCIRCGACMNHCPVYHAIGGHAYGNTYPGPLGAVLAPNLFGIEAMGNLPNASTFCGRCEAVCPMRIPLPKLMRQLRERQYEGHLTPATQRWGLGIWAHAAKRPQLYRLATGIAARILSRLGGSRGRVSSLPLASGWTRYRDLPTPAGKTFMAQWREKTGARLE